MHKDVVARVRQARSGENVVLRYVRRREHAEDLEPAAVTLFRSTGPRETGTVETRGAFFSGFIFFSRSSLFPSRLQFYTIIHANASIHPFTRSSSLCESRSRRETKRENKKAIRKYTRSWEVGKYSDFLKSRICLLSHIFLFFFFSIPGTTTPIYQTHTPHCGPLVERTRETRKKKKCNYCYYYFPARARDPRGKQPQ